MTLVIDNRPLCLGACDGGFHGGAAVRFYAADGALDFLGSDRIEGFIDPSRPARFEDLDHAFAAAKAADALWNGFVASLNIMEKRS